MIPSKRLISILNKFALWIDMRTYPDNNIHGSGLEITTTRDGVNLEIRRRRRPGSSSRVLTCYMFVVADAVMAIMNGNLKEIVY